MADAPKSGSPFTLLFIVIGAVAVLVILWFINGGPSKADLRGLFLEPPAPLGPGGAYGPQIGTTSQYYNDNYR
jgi:hypothetical protein